MNDLEKYLKSGMGKRFTMLNNFTKGEIPATQDLTW